MQFDCHGLPLTTDSADAVRHFDTATLRFLAHGRDTVDHLASALAADPGLTVALAAKGLFTLLLARGELADAVACARPRRACAHAAEPIASGTMSPPCRPSRPATMRGRFAVSRRSWTTIPTMPWPPS